MYKQYDEIVKQHRKQLSLIAKNAVPYDYEDTLNLLVSSLRFMLEYYLNNENVHSEELEGQPLRIDTLKQALAEYDAYYDCDNALYENLEVDDELVENASEIIKEHHKKCEKHWNNFWNIVRDNILSWWD